MANYIIDLDVSTMTWTDHATGSPLATGDECERDFVLGELSGSTYTGVTINFQNGDWKACGSGESEGNSMTLNLPSSGSASTHSFCVCADESFGDACYRKGWFDPKLKLKNQDASGSPSAYQNAGPCSCGS